jgi:hypothetical protein
MPFKSEAQRRYLWSQHPEIARRWTREGKGEIMREPKSMSKPLPPWMQRFGNKSQSAEKQGNPAMEARTKMARKRLAKLKGQGK